MKKLTTLALSAMMAMSLAACTQNTPQTSSGTDTVKGTYTVEIRGFDWGCGTTQAIVTLDNALDSVKAEDFTVKETKQATDWTAEGFPVIETEFERKVTGAKLSDDGKTLTLDLYCNPDQGSPFLYTMATGYNTWCDPYYQIVDYISGGQIFSIKDQRVNILGFSGHSVPVATTQLYHSSAKVAMDNT